MHAWDLIFTLGIEVTRREQMSLKGKIKEGKVEKQAAKVKGKSQKKPPSKKDDKAASPSPALKKSKHLIWGSPEHKKRRRNVLTDDQKSDAPDHASEACPTEFYEPPATKPKKNKVMKRPSAKMSEKAEVPEELPEPREEIVTEASNPVLQKKTFARRFCPAGKWSQLKWLTIRKMFMHRLYKVLPSPSKYEDCGLRSLHTFHNVLVTFADWVN